MNEFARLTKRESEITELFAWGATKKDVANRLFLSERTIENHARNIYRKTGCTKVNELSAWWFCKSFNISFDLSPLKRKMCSLFLLCVLTPQIFKADNDNMMLRTRTTKTCRASRSRRDSDVTPLFEF